MNKQLENLLKIGGMVLATASAVDLYAPRQEYDGLSKSVAFTHFYPRQETEAYARQILPGDLGFWTGISMLLVALSASQTRKQEEEAEKVGREVQKEVYGDLLEGIARIHSNETVH